MTNTTQPEPGHCLRRLMPYATALLLMLIFAWSAVAYRRAAINIECKQRLKDLHLRALGPGQNLATAAELANATPPSLLECPACKSAYVYRPFTGRVTYTGNPRRAIAWCPSPSHSGHRNVLLENGAVVELDANSTHLLAATRPVIQK